MRKEPPYIHLGNICSQMPQVSLDGREMPREPSRKMRPAAQKRERSRVWKHLPVILATWRLRQEDCQRVNPTLYSRVKICLNNKITPN